MWIKGQLLAVLYTPYEKCLVQAKANKNVLQYCTNLLQLYQVGLCYLLHRLFLCPFRLDQAERIFL